MSAPSTPDKTPEWMLLLEKKKNRPHRLAHEIGAGAPCLACGDKCPGLDLHFWRKVCRNCKCKKEEHDVKDDDGYAQFEILLGAGDKRKKPGAVLKIKIPDIVDNAVAASKTGVPFDWVPPNVSEDIAAEYMQQLPAAKLPISGSDGALYRRQQLERQMPLHDLDAGQCHNLTSEEIEELRKYLDNLKSNVVGQGRVTKVPSLFTEQRLAYRGPTLHSSYSDQSLRSLPPLPSTYNAVPRPFQQQSNMTDEDLPPPLPESLPPDCLNNLKTPSSFMPNKSVTGYQYSTNVAHSSSVPGQLYPNSTGLYGEIRDTNASLASSGYSNNVAQSSVVPGQFYPNASGSYKEIRETNKNDACNDTLYPYASNVAHSTGVPGQLYPGSSQQEPRQQGCEGSVTQGYNIAGNVPYGTYAQDGSLIATPYDPAHGNSAGGLPQYGTTSNPLPPYQSNSLAGVGSIGTQNQQNYPEIHGKQTDAHYLNENWSRNAQMPEDMRYEHSLLKYDVAGSSDIQGNSMPLSAQIKQSNVMIANELASQMELLSAEEHPVGSHLSCKHCSEVLIAGNVAVFADRAGENTAWHPNCFVCNTCDELLVDLIYFFNKGNVYCGRHFAELLDIPRCYACDELIFVKEYTVAEGKTFHVKHFCCYECDVPLAGKQYIPVDDQPTCIECYQEIFGKRCHTCGKQIGAGQQRVGWKQLNWHAVDKCFRCHACAKSLLGGKFVMDDQQPFCNKDCALLGGGEY